MFDKLVEKFAWLLVLFCVIFILPLIIFAVIKVGYVNLYIDVLVVILVFCTELILINALIVLKK